MRSTSLIVLAAVGASAQLPTLPSSLFGLSFSAPCQQAILGAVTNSSFASCFPINDLLPILTMPNASIIPALDMFMTDLCYNDPPCSNDTLQAAASTILSGCASDLAGEGLSNMTVTTAFSTYPLVREVLCLKTSNPYTNQSFGGILGDAPIPISSAYNMTNGTFCVSSVLTQLSAYFGTNLTTSFIASAVSGMNSTAVGLVKGISSTVLCNECIFGAVDLIEEAYPIVGMAPIAPVLSYLNMTAPANLTLNDLLNGTCAYDGLAVTMNGTLPVNVTESIVNSTFPLNVTMAMRK